jgi:hypothetical protein
VGNERVSTRRIGGQAAEGRGAELGKRSVAIGRNPHEVEAWKAAGHTIFFLKAGWTNIEFWQQVQKLARCFPNIVDCARRLKPGESFIVTVNGKIS